MILLIGNGPISERAAEAMADATFVVRFNECRSFELLPGMTHALAVCNTGRPGRIMSESSAWRTHQATTDAGEIWCVREPGKFREIRDDLVRLRPELSDFCDDYTPAFTQFAADQGKSSVVLDRQVYDEVDMSLRQLTLTEYIAPSSGILALHYALKRFRDTRLVLAGFSHTGWQWHPFPAERDLVDRHIRSGRVQRL